MRTARRDGAAAAGPTAGGAGTATEGAGPSGRRADDPRGRRAHTAFAVVASAAALLWVLAACGSGTGGTATTHAGAATAHEGAASGAAGGADSGTGGGAPTTAVHTAGEPAPRTGGTAGPPDPGPVGGANDGGAGDGGAGDGGAGDGGGAGCGVDPWAPAITEAIGVLSANQPSPYGWTYIGEADYDPCADLSYAMAETPGATASSPMQLMLFHRGEYVGTGTWCPLPYTTVIGSSGDQVDVRYRWIRGDDTSAGPSGETTTSYVWNGQGVTMTAPLPEDMPPAVC